MKPQRGPARQKRTREIKNMHLRLDLEVYDRIHVEAEAAGQSIVVFMDRLLRAALLERKAVAP